MSSEPSAMQRPASAGTSGRAEEKEVGGWVVFAGILILLAGIVNLIYGISAVAESSFYVGNTRFVFSDLKTWGWIVLLIGALQSVVSLGIFARAPWARWTGVFFASLNAIAQLLFIAANPWLSLAVFALDILVIYGLVAHWEREAI